MTGKNWSCEFMSEMSVMTHVHVYFYVGRHTFPSLSVEWTRCNENNQDPGLNFQ